MRIAVIGSGMAGLACAWSLSRSHKVTLFERHARPGLAAHAVDIEGESVDVPLRVFFEGYYPTLMRLYERLGVATEAIDYSGSFSSPQRGVYFSYFNRIIGGRAIPIPRGAHAVSRIGVSIARDSLRLVAGDAVHGVWRDAESTTIDEYLKARGYSEGFIDGFIIPTYAAVCTCSYEAVRAYPARVILDYFTSGMFLGRVRRVRDSASAAVIALTAGIDQLRCNSMVQRVKANKESVSVYADGAHSRFDHAVFATQANQAADLVDGTGDHDVSTLRSFAYEPSRVVLHRDSSLMPPERRYWSPVNFWVDSTEDKPSATIWMNAVQPALKNAEPLFQTWNPLRPIAADSIVTQSEFERPVVNVSTTDAVEALAALHHEPERRLWYCGSYAGHGIPLLEAAAKSGLEVAERIGGCQANIAEL